MDFYDFIFLKWLLDKDNKNKQNNEIKKPKSLILLIIKLFIFYFIFLIVYGALMYALWNLEMNEKLFLTYNCIYIGISVIAIISNIVSHLKQ